MASGEIAGNQQRSHPFASRVIKVDALFIAQQLKDRTAEGQPNPLSVSRVTESIENLKPWHAEKVTRFLNRLMEKQKIT